LLKEPQQTESLLEKLDEVKAHALEIVPVLLNEKSFWWNMNENAMATEKSAEGIRKFTEDLLKIKQQITNFLAA
jgi:transaldolase